MRVCPGNKYPKLEGEAKGFNQGSLSSFFCVLKLSPLNQELTHHNNFNEKYLMRFYKKYIHKLKWFDVVFYNVKLLLL